MTPIDILRVELAEAERKRDLASAEDHYARLMHFKAQEAFSDAVDKVKALMRAIEVLENQ